MIANETKTVGMGDAGMYCLIMSSKFLIFVFFFFQAEDGIRDISV